MGPRWRCCKEMLEEDQEEPSEDSVDEVWWGQQDMRWLDIDKSEEERKKRKDGGGVLMREEKKRSLTFVGRNGLI